MLKPPGPIAPRSYVEAYQRQQAELEQRWAASVRPDYFAGHPGFAESLIPVWGSGREAIADFKEGDVPGGIINSAAAASDLFLAGAAGKTAAKLLIGGAKAAGKTIAEHGGVEVLKAGAGQIKRDIATLSKPTRAGRPPWNYKRVQPRMKDYGLVKKGEELHHWGAPQNGWGTDVPNVIKNNPLNLHPMPKQAHQLTHKNLPSEGLTKYDPLRRYMRALRPGRKPERLQ